MWCHGHTTGEVRGDGRIRHHESFLQVACDSCIRRFQCCHERHDSLLDAFKVVVVNEDALIGVRLLFAGDLLCCNFICKANDSLKPSALELAGISYPCFRSLTLI
jgi:hypothetical protein